MPLESHHKISVRTKRQKSSAETRNTNETIRERVRAIMKREKDESGKKIIQETRGNLKELLRQMKPKNTPDKKTDRKNGGDGESDWNYKGLGATSVKNADETMKMKVLGLKFGNESGEIALGAMHESQKDTREGEARGSMGIGLAGSFRF